MDREADGVNSRSWRAVLEALVNGAYGSVLEPLNPLQIGESAVLCRYGEGFQQIVGPPRARQGGVGFQSARRHGGWRADSETQKEVAALYDQGNSGSDSWHQGGEVRLMAARSAEERGVFINCPFSGEYRPFFEAILFVIARSGFEPRCALESDDGGENRFDKICKIIEQCRYGVHDISNTELDEDSRLPRFNMPLELGLFLGARKFGGAKHKVKKTIIFDREPHRYQAFISDIAGQDIHWHHGAVDQLIEELAAWLRREVRDPDIPGGRAIAGEFARFQSELDAIVAIKRLHRDELTFIDLTIIAAAWMTAGNR